MLIPFLYLTLHYFDSTCVIYMVSSTFSGVVDILSDRKWRLSNIMPL